MDIEKLPRKDKFHPETFPSDVQRQDEDKIFVEISRTPALSAWTDDEDKSVAWSDGKVVFNTQEKETVCRDRDDKEFFDATQVYNPRPEEPRPNRICGLRRPWFFVILCSLLAALALGLGLGLGITLSQNAKDPQPKSNATSSYNIGGSLDAKYYSTSGAFNGSGIALNTQTIGNGDGDLILYFQHFGGAIRWMRMHEGEWSGGTASETVANDAKNNTPISATSYTANGSSEWHVFYIDKKNQIRERVNSNLTTIWADGALSKTPLLTYNANQVGMSACLYGSVFNDSDYANRTMTTEATEIGIHLRYMSENKTMEQYGWRQGDQEWAPQRNWTDVNPHSGIGCNAWGIGTVDYIMIANPENEIEIWGKDTASVDNDWENMTPSDGLDKVHPSTSFAYNGFFYAQDAETNLIKAYNFSWAGFNTSIRQAIEIEGHPAVPGTHLGATTMPRLNGTTSTIFYQETGNDISYLVLDPVTGTWDRTSIAIPDN